MLVPTDFAVPVLPTTTWQLLLSVLLVYCLYTTIYRLFFCPIAHFPGPKLAALTYWYEFYFEIVLNGGGQFTRHIADLHQQYGPIVRINPGELHISDPAFITTLYTRSKPQRNKYRLPRILFTESTFLTAAHNEHHQRRAILAPAFTNTKIRQLQTIIEQKADVWIKQLNDACGMQRPVEVAGAFSAFTEDVVRTFTVGSCNDRTGKHDFGDTSFRKIAELTANAHHSRQFGILTQAMEFTMRNLSIKRAEQLVPMFGDMLRQQEKLEEAIVSGGVETVEGTGLLSVCGELTKDQSSKHMCSPNRIAQEAMTIINAGSHTTSWALTVGLYYILADTDILQKLKHDIRETVGSGFEASAALPSLAQLEQIPYLTAVINESLRLSYGITARHVRVAPDEDMIFTSGSSRWVIPKGVPVGMNAYQLHHDEKLFPDSHHFRPERWLQNPGLDKYLAAFGFGGRACLGKGVAYAEMRIMLTKLMMLYGSPTFQAEDDIAILQLTDTTKADVQMAHDGLTPLPPKTSLGVRLKVRMTES